MRIFLTGATGYIGSAVLDALVRAGHMVTALARDPARLALAGSPGVQPLAGDLSNAAAWAGPAEGHDVYIHAAFEWSARGPDTDSRTIDALLAVAQRNPVQAPGRAVIYTSGIWVLGNTRHPAEEDHPLQPAAHVAWRPGHEARVLQANGRGVRTMVVRPGIVYGGGRGIIGEFFKSASNGLLRVIGPGQNHWPLVYDRDLADLYLRLAVNPDASGVYHATDHGDERVNDVVGAIAAHMNVPPDIRHVPLAEAKAKQGPVAEALALDQVVRSPRARALGWAPTLDSVADNVSALFEEWRQAQE